MPVIRRGYVLELWGPQEFGTLVALVARACLS